MERGGEGASTLWRLGPQENRKVAPGHTAGDSAGKRGGEAGRTYCALMMHSALYLCAPMQCSQQPREEGTAVIPVSQNNKLTARRSHFSKVT